ncbi:MAG: hypothetical protein U1E62_09040 [Alsobacter sp.]
MTGPERLLQHRGPAAANAIARFSLQPRAMVTLVLMMAGLGCLLAYVPLQRRTLAQYAGGWWLCAAAPPAGLAGYGVVLMLSGANLWPLSLLFAASIAGFWLLLLVIARRLTCGTFF